MKNEKEPSSLSIIITFILLLLAIGSYSLITKYITATPNEKVETIEKESEGEISEENAKKIAKEKYYIAVATLTNTKSDIDKLYNQIKTTEEVLTDQALIDNLNNMKGKTFAQNSVITVVNNYNEAIEDNFTEEYINNNILGTNGFITNINNEYYIYKEKIDNYFFKEAQFKLITKNQETMTFTVQNINYASSCITEGKATPNIACTDTDKSDKLEFKITKNGSKWKIDKLIIKTN